MFCKYCGAKLDDDAAFCPACGKPANAERGEAPEPKAPRKAAADDSKQPKRGKAAAEQYIAVCYRHWFAYIPGAIVAFFFALGGIASLMPGGPTLIDAAVCFLLAAGVWFFSKTLVSSDYIGLTGRDIVIHTGFIRTKEMVCPVAKVQNVVLSNGLLGKIFRFHTIAIDNAGTGQLEYKFKRAAGAPEFAAAVRELIH